MERQAAKRSVYVGGLAEEVTSGLVHAAFVPFGEISDVQLPLDYETQKHRGFAFVEFELAADASSAIDNMNDAELYGRTLRVNLARPTRTADGTTSRALWAEDSWLQEHAGATLTEETEGDKDTSRLVSRIEQPAPRADRLPEVYIDVHRGNTACGRIVIRLRSDVVPRTVENFRCLCTHERGFGFKGSTFHRVIPNFMCQGGDFTNHNGTGGKSIYGGKFDDENFQLKHEMYCVAMANSGPNSNGSQFYISTGRTEWLNGKHVVFGQVISGIDVVKQMEAAGSKSGKPSEKIKITGCGELSG